MDTIDVIEPGFLTTVQDTGRYGYQRYGVPVAGPMDPFALRAANLLVGNPVENACLEITMLGPKLRFLIATTMALAGADLTPTLDGIPIPTWREIKVNKGSIIEFQHARSGVRAYLSVASGFDVPKVMESRSTYLNAGIGGIQGRPIQTGDVLRTLRANLDSSEKNRTFPTTSIPSYGSDQKLRVVMGPQDNFFTEEGIKTFLTSQYTVGNDSDRMGCHLDGPPVQHKNSADIISDGTSLGAVQIPANGRPIILMADRGTTGGYAKIATIISADIHKVAQATPFHKIRFTSVTLEQAYQAAREQEKTLHKIEEISETTERSYKVTVNDKKYQVTAEIEKPLKKRGEDDDFNTILTHKSVQYTIQVREDWAKHE